MRRWLPGERSQTLNLPSRKVVVHLGGADAPTRSTRTEAPARGASESAVDTAPDMGAPGALAIALSSRYASTPPVSFTSVPRCEGGRAEKGGGCRRGTRRE